MKFDIDVQAGAAPARPRERTRPLSRNPERIAWVVVLGSFLVCVLLSITLPLGLRHYVLYAMESRSSMLQAVNITQNACGTVRFTPPNAAQPTAVGCQEMAFPENSWIETDQSSRAFIEFFDGSTATVYSSSRLLVQQMRQPRFQWSEDTNTIEINQTSGLVLYAPAPAAASGGATGQPVRFTVHTPNFEVTLNEGSYSLEVTGQGSQIVVTFGSAIVRALDGSRAVTVGQGQRLRLAEGQALSDPIPAAQDLVEDGAFEAPIKCPPDDQTVWRCYFDQGGDGGSINGSLNTVTVGDRHALQILRTGAGTNSAITGMRQILNRDVSYFHSLVLSADVRLHYQTLSGGGYLSSEYPLIILLRYRDVDGNELVSVRGFYYQNDNNNPTLNGQQIPVDKWIPYQSGNLLAAPGAKPFYLIDLEIYASGWDYESYISGIRLTVE